MSQRAFVRVKGEGIQVLKKQFLEVQEPPVDEASKTSLLGTPVWSNLVFPAGSYETLEGDIIDFPELSFDTVLFTISQSKNVVTTAIQGRNGTVKEYISDGDYSISISGAVVSENADTYPEIEVLNLIEVLKAPVSIRIQSEFLSLFEIDEVAITGYDFSEKVGSRNTQPFSITALSDDPLELRDLQNL